MEKNEEVGDDVTEIQDWHSFKNTLVLSVFIKAKKNCYRAASFVSYFISITYVV